MNKPSDKAPKFYPGVSVERILPIFFFPARLLKHVGDHAVLSGIPGVSDVSAFSFSVMLDESFPHMQGSISTFLVEEIIDSSPLFIWFG